jgi:hypothetical protein
VSATQQGALRVAENDRYRVSIGPKFVLSSLRQITANDDHAVNVVNVSAPLILQHVPIN